MGSQPDPRQKGPQGDSSLERDSAPPLWDMPHSSPVPSSLAASLACSVQAVHKHCPLLSNLLGVGGALHVGSSPSFQDLLSER